MCGSCLCCLYFFSCWFHAKRIQDDQCKLVFAQCTVGLLEPSDLGKNKGFCPKGMFEATFNDELKLLLWRKSELGRFCFFLTKSWMSWVECSGSQFPSLEIDSWDNSETFSKVTTHCELLEYWNTQKSLWRVLQHFSCLLDEGIPKIWKKLNSHNGFLRAD